ncbi:MarR family winged helix-turn-helix transcriptional regulator [Streptomyces sp. SL13]|uniref:MarR family winged helix-turn-helix transcriptional regulator n=1 Tax=Streptantibioticus silvisoli TaxID=2705255 RepID=A0AA90HGB5_9ACTN|nr:MarR family winged helix-turn-helix transcriptional regulator [Streptantibioticus silvisoli]MDI5974422.1 MarR family winged helix-turn-helix transcriptional regulator [Streptantibioticus silvisoli]
MGTVHGTGASVTRPENDGEPGSATAQEAASGLGNEIIRFTRLIAAWKHSANDDARAADRVLLARLVVGGDRRATDLAADAFLDLSTVSRQVRSLVERGLVERHPDPEDRRGSLLTATAAGREAFEHYKRIRDTKLAALLEPWTGEDRYQLIRLMARLNDDLVEHHQPRDCSGGSTGTAAKQGESQE